MVFSSSCATEGRLVDGLGFGGGNLIRYLIDREMNRQRLEWFTDAYLMCLVSAYKKIFLFKDFIQIRVWWKTL